MKGEISYDLIQNGVVVASVSGTDPDRVRAEIMHYAMMYSEDGPCTIKGPDVMAFHPRTNKTS